MYTVFSIDNADRLTLLGPPMEGNACTLVDVELSYVECPQQGRRRPGGEFTEGEPFGREAVELMRNTFLGKNVVFKENYPIPSLQRLSGEVKLAEGGLDASCMLLKEGLAAVPFKQPKGMNSALYKKYFDLMKVAFAGKKGIFAPEKEQVKHTHHMLNMPSEKLLEMVHPLLGSTLRITVERVMSATSLIIMCPEKFGEAQIPVLFSGVTARGIDEKYSTAAKFITEKHLLHRQVTAHVDGIDGFENVLISVVSSISSSGASLSSTTSSYFQAELLSRGLCKLSSGTLGQCPGVEFLQKAVEDAKHNRKGIWENYEPPVPEAPAVLTVCSTSGEETTANHRNASAAGGKAPGAASELFSSGPVPTFDNEDKPGPAYTGLVEFTGKLIQVIHGDTLVIREQETKQSIRVGLAGVRCRKSIHRDKDGNAPECRVTYSDYTWEAMEFTRTKYIGAQVQVHIVYARAVPPRNDLRPAAVVKLASTGVNIGTALLEEGLGTFFLGKSGICPCATEYQAAEAAAKEAGRNIYADNKETLRSTTILELSHLGDTRSRYYLSFLQRGMQGNRPPVRRGIVDVVMNGNSMRIYLPSENFQIPVRLAGVVAPSGGFGSEAPDPFFNECKDFVVDLVQQREVSVQVYATDRPGNFISAILLPDGSNLSVVMVKKGLAACGNADRLPFQTALQEAEKEAQTAERCIWSSAQSLPQRVTRMQTKQTASGGGGFLPISSSNANGAKESDVTEEIISCVRTEVVENGLSLYLRYDKDDTEEISENISVLLKQLIGSTTGAAGDESRLTVGQLVAVQYKSDKQWYRGKVLRAFQSDGHPAAQVQFVDYGTVQKSTMKEIRSIPKLGDYTYLLNTPPLAFLAKLAYIKPRIPKNVAHLASELAFEYTEGPLFAKAEYRDPAGTIYYSITAEEGEFSLNEELLQNGAVFFDPRAAPLNPSVAKKHHTASEHARSAHLGAWTYGDADDDEDYE